MNRRIQILSIVLGIQLTLAVILMVTGQDTGAFVSKEAWIGLELPHIDKITIEEIDKPVLIVIKQGGNWRMPDYFDFPVDPDKLEQVIGKLFGINKSWPIAATASAEKRFKVAEDSFERKITFVKDDETAKTLLIGSSPSYRKVHARLTNETEIYAITFGAFEANTKPEEWADKSYLRMERDEVEELILPSVNLKREGETITVRNLKENEVVDDSQVSELIDKFTRLSFLEVLGKAEKPEYQQELPELEIELVAKSGDQTKYLFTKLKDSDDYVLKRSTDDYYFKIAKYVAEGLAAFSRETLVKETPEQKIEESEDQNQPPDLS